MFNKIIGISAAFFALSFIGTGCTAQTGASSESSADEAVTTTPAADFFSCHVDSDCVAVPKVGCCPNGIKVAVNKGEKTGYEHSQVCNEEIACPLYVIQDTRVAQCNTETSKCEMVAPDAIECGGFVRNPHHCPSGYECAGGVHHNPDAPGKCEAKSDDSQVTCGNTVCGEGEVCCNALDGICTKPGEACIQ